MTSSSDPGSVASSVDQNVGFHFTLSSNLSYRRPPGCLSLHVGYVLHPGVFADPYELDQRAESYAYTIGAMPDLERPVSAVEDHDTLLRLDLQLPSDAEGAIEVALPLHGRYGLPSSELREEAYAVVYVPPPQAFWQCREGQGALCDAPVISQLTCFASDIYAIPLTTAPPAKDIPLLIPVGSSDDLVLVESGTTITVLAVFCYMALVFSKVHNRFINHLYQSKRE